MYHLLRAVFTDINAILRGEISGLNTGTKALLCPKMNIQKACY